VRHDRAVAPRQDAHRAWTTRAAGSLGSPPLFCAHGR
jgi:hypothetical protein